VTARARQLDDATITCPRVVPAAIASCVGSGIVRRRIDARIARDGTVARIRAGVEAAVVSRHVRVATARRVDRGIHPGVRRRLVVVARAPSAVAT
jgi:hypothetical protein